MDVYLKIIAAILIATVACIVLRNNNASITILVVTAACCMAVLSAAAFIKPIVAFCERLRDVGDLNNNVIEILLKAVGVGLLSQISGLLCIDSQNAALGKTVNFISATVILWLSLPLLEELVSLIETILGAI